MATTDEILRAILARGLKRGRPKASDKRFTIEARKPWQKLGVSRRTFYRRLAEVRNMMKHKETI